MIFRSIKFQITAALTLQAIVLISVVFSTLYLLKLRQHDYLILNLSGQLRIIALTLTKQSENYVNFAPRSYEAYNRDLVLFNTGLKKQINDYDKIIYALRERSISAELVSYFYLAASESSSSTAPTLDEAIQCQWDEQSRNQLVITVNDWEIFKQGLNNALGANPKEPRLELAAKYIVSNKESILSSTAKLSTSFRQMMEIKIQQIDMLNKSAIYIIILISLSILVILYFKLFKPIDTTVKGFKRIANGELDYQVKVGARNEIGDMTIAFNSLTQRIHSMFQLTDGINQVNDLDGALKFLLNEFSAFIPIEWISFAQHESDQDFYQLSRIHCNCNIKFKEQEQFDSVNSFYERGIKHKKPLSIHSQSSQDYIQSDPFLHKLNSSGFKSFILVPLVYNVGNTSKNSAALIFASTTENAYTIEHQEFLSNITPQISHAVNKTIGMESLIISAVEGLAKLAESRDPETGDHLYRMSHYSKIVAEQLSIEGPYVDHIDANYIRSILRFAPMHDIGKVGIGDYILLKPGPLTDEERATMQQHPSIGAEVLRRCEQQVQSFGSDIFKLGIEIAEGHHEKFDGSGYPKQIVGNDIPLSARIVAVADVFDALTSKRPYKEAWTIEKAVSVMNEDTGTHFDPDVMTAFEQAMPEILKIYDKYKHV